MGSALEMAVSTFEVVGEVPDPVGPGVAVPLETG